MTVRITTEDFDAGREIAARSDRSDRGFSNSSVRLRMILRNKAGKETTRTLSIKTLEVPDEDVGDQCDQDADGPGEDDQRHHARL